MEASSPGIKFNFSGSVNPFTLAAGIDGIVKDHHSLMLITYTGSYPAEHPLEAEL